jgi:hypothetical protein
MTKDLKALAAKAPSDTMTRFHAWLERETGLKLDLKSVQLAASYRMDFQQSPENQAALKSRRAEATAPKPTPAPKQAKPVTKSKPGPHTKDAQAKTKDTTLTSV